MRPCVLFLVATGLSTSVLISPASATGYDDVLASRINVEKSAIGYGITFVPKNNSYSYQIQVAGKGLINDLACDRFAATEQQKLDWKTVKIKIGTDNSALYAESQVVPVLGGQVYRNKVASSIHIRVVVSDENKKEIYKSNWIGGEDIKGWGWTGNCAWVSE
ncbi:hypothetical protein H6G06_25425 [Anabaena sphaerica FACHB-251]|uniref:Uncharacterized protein n=2 Tax=Anabaena TaxID=1163 RepID=A0A926WM92_9NOST|nr:hypothetical protein [Anabaena sphaerica FACHB-251]